MAGRWSALTRDPAVTVGDRDAAVEVQARALLRRYGVVSRRVLLREPPGAPWRDLVRVYRRLEARGEIRGGRFITGLAGEQFALPEAVVELRRVRREGPRNNRVVLSAADPLNLTGVFDASARVPALQTNSVVYLDGVPVTPREAGRRAREQEFATTSQLSAAGEMLASSGR